MLRKENKHFEQHSIHQIFGKKITRLLALSLFSLNTLADISSNELPQGADVVSGDITINSNDNVMNIDQDSQQGIIDWQTFNVGSDATVNFNQPNSSASTLNRVVTDNATQIYGNINANGQVLLVNSSGVYISENGRVETGGIVATTQEIENQEYLDNPDRIILRETDQSGSIENHGTVIANEAYVAMLAPEVQNEGLITANMGEVVLASGREIILSFNDGQITDVITTPSLLNSLIENKLAIEAAGGKVILSATAMNQINGGLINQAGRINVGSTETVAVNEGGRIYLTSNEVVFDGGSQTLANGDTQGGEIEVAANDITIEEDARIEASATLNGDGGRIELVAQNDVTINGVIKADGADEGLGGEILTQGEQVILEDNAQISAKSGENAPIIQENNIKILENDEIVAQNTNQGNWRIVSAASVWTQTHASVIELALLNANVAETVNADLCVTNCSSDQVGDLAIGDDITFNNRSTTLTQLELTASDYLSLQGTISDEHQNLILEATGFRGLSLGTVADITANQVSFRSEEQLDVLGNVTTTGNENTNPLANFIGANMVMAGLIQTSNQTRLGRIVMTALNQINLRPESKVLANGDAGGTVLINARHIDLDGFIQSNGGTGRGGTITLDIEKTVDMNQTWIESNGFDAGGIIKIQVRDGPLNMDATRIQTNASNGRGGTILISGLEHTRITSSHIESKGTSQGGEIYLGYDQDNQHIPFSKYLYISKNTIVDARNFNNTNGGFVETSGHVVNILATINVGRGGMWLIDPFDVTISNAASGDPYSANFDPTQTTILNASSIEGSLNSGTDVSITTGSATANTLTVDFAIQPKSYSGATLTLTGGTIDINKDITGDGVDLNLVLNGATIDIDNSISLGGGNLTINASSSGDISSSYSITAQNIIKSGSGDFTVNSSSTISGDVTINAGAIIIAAATPFGDQDINVNSGGTLNFNNINYGGKGSINLNGGTLSASGGTSTLSNDSAINLLANSTIDVASSAELTLNGVISGSGSLTKSGSGTLTLSGTNTFSGTVNISAGSLAISNSSALGTTSGNTTVSDGATLQISGGITVAENMYVNGSGVSSNGAVYFLSGKNTYSGAIVLQSNTTMTSAAGDQTFSGTINGAYDLTITAAGNWSQEGVIGGSSALADFSLTASTGNVYTWFITASGSINIFGVNVSQGFGTSITAGNNEDIIISATGNYSIAYGSASNALVTSGTGRWIVYAADDDNSNFGDSSNGYLNSNNTPLWGATYSTLAPASVPSGNRYVFAETSSQTVTFTTTSETITYADSYDLSDNYLITTSGVAGLANVYDITSSGSQITLETAYSSNPTVTISTNSGSNSTSGNLVAGSYTLGISVAGGTLRSGYTLATSETGSITVNQKALTVSGITADDKTYDGTTTATVNTDSAAFTGLVDGDSVSIDTSGVIARIAQSDVGTNISVSLSGLSLTGDDASNYSSTLPSGATANITAKALTYTVDAADKTYDGTDAATVTITLSGLVGAETLTTTETSTFAQSTVGSGITVTVDSISLVDGTGDASNYTITSGQTDTADITAKSLTVSGITAANKTYDGDNTATIDYSSAVFTGLVSGDTVTVTATGTFTDA
ncbi:YDG domain-containing protein, partial [Methylophilaceae bacterium]|nr:YDG domain-containing protein [Methylophilaceae bacterium]